MIRRYIRTALIMCAMAIAITGAAQDGSHEGGFDLFWNTIDGGGGVSTGGGFEIAGTIGQHDAGAAMTGGSFELIGGFWTAMADPVDLCPADINDDGLINVTDLLLVINNWGAGAGNAADVNDDGTVNVQDLLAVISAWGACP